MDDRRPAWSRFLNLPKVNWGLFAIGIVLLLLAALVGPLPGPGGIFLAIPGLAFILKSSIWAKRYYVRVKRWQPRAGRWMDWGLRRQSAARREALAKAEASRSPVTGD